MTTKVRRCKEPGCRTLTARGKCPVHAAAPVGADTDASDPLDALRAELTPERVAELKAIAASFDDDSDAVEDAVRRVTIATRRVQVAELRDAGERLERRAERPVFHG